MTNLTPAVRESHIPVTREKILVYLNSFGLTTQLSPQESEYPMILSTNYFIDIWN